LIGEIQNQESKWKIHVNIGAKIDQIRVKLKKLEVYWSTDGQDAQIQNQGPK